MPAGFDGVYKNLLRRPLREAESLLRRPTREGETAGRCSLSRTPHGAGTDSGVFSKNENKGYYLSVPFTLCPHGEATHTGLRILRSPRSPGRLRFRARVAHGLCTTATGAHPLGDDDHHHNNSGHDARRGRRKPRQCDHCDYNARRKYHHRDRSTASAPAGCRAGSAVSSVCVARRLLDMAQQQWV